MTVTDRTARSVVDFVPWDAESTEHIDRMVAQRIDCTWDIDKPAGPWKEAVQKEIKCIYWLVSTIRRWGLNPTAKTSPCPPLTRTGPVERRPSS